MRRYLFTGMIVIGLCAAPATRPQPRADSAVPNSASEVHPLLIGAEAPQVTLRNSEGDAVALTDVLDGKRTILFFYRGGW